MGAVVWSEVLQSVVDGDDLGEGTSFDIIDSVLSGGADDAQLAALAVGVRMKGETVNELVGFARATLARSLPLRDWHFSARCIAWKGRPGRGAG